MGGNSRNSIKLQLRNNLLSNQAYNIYFNNRKNPTIPPRSYKSILMPYHQFQHQLIPASTNAHKICRNIQNLVLDRPLIRSQYYGPCLTYTFVYDVHVTQSRDKDTEICNYMIVWNGGPFSEKQSFLKLTYSLVHLLPARTSNLLQLVNFLSLTELSYLLNEKISCFTRELRLFFRF